MVDVHKTADPQDPRSPHAVLPGPVPAGELAEESVTSTLPVTAEPEAPRTGVQLALHAGWTVAVLYGKIPAPPADGVPELPTVHELHPGQRRRLELSRLRHLLRQLASLPECAGSGLPTEVPDPPNDADQADFKRELEALNLVILHALTGAKPDIELAYQLGRSLRDTAGPPQEYATDMMSLAPVLARQLARGRVSRLQQWLATLSTQFPPHAAAIVAASMGRWSDFAAVTVNPRTTMLKKGDQAEVAQKMCVHLLPQGDIWLSLLVGADSTAGLRRSTAILRRLRRRYGFMLVLVAAVLGAVIYLIVTYTSGAVAVLTSIAAIGGSLGITAKGIASMTASVMTKEATRPIFSLAGEAEEDAMVWAITTMPPVKLKARGVRRLRKAGIAATSTLGQV
jgi:hypothetical protein